MTNRSVFGSYPHFACIGLGVFLVVASIMIGAATPLEHATYFVLGVGFSALGRFAFASSGDLGEARLWAKMLTASSWIVGTLFVIATIAMTWFVIALLRSFSRAPGT